MTRGPLLPRRRVSARGGARRLAALAWVMVAVGSACTDGPAGPRPPGVYAQALCEVLGTRGARVAATVAALPDLSGTDPADPEAAAVEAADALDALADELDELADAVRDLGWPDRPGARDRVTALVASIRGVAVTVAATASRLRSDPPDTTAGLVAALTTVDVELPDPGLTTDPVLAEAARDAPACRALTGR